MFQPAKAHVEYQPLGVIGIITPWNYPIFLSLGPLTTALAAGNRAMIKMSELTLKTSALLQSLIAKEFDDNLICIVDGDADVAAEFSQLSFEHLFFTGSTKVGQLVMQAAAKNLVPVTLELGGKSPAIIDPNMELQLAAERFVFGKSMNAGQTCVAPDYILCPKGKTVELIESIKKAYNKLYPTIAGNKDCTSIVCSRMYNRLQLLLEDAKNKGGKVIPLSSDVEEPLNRKMPLTLISGVDDDMQVMEEEIFGPILPIVEYSDLQQAISYIQDKERPLALYIYSFDSQFQNDILKHTHAGGVCINDAAFHVAVEDLPFGGIGASGMGQYHGEEGFKTFSHGKSVFTRGRISLGSLIHPPFGKAIHNLIFNLFVR